MKGTALGTRGWLPIAASSVGKQAEKGLSSITISSPCSSVSRSYGRSLVHLMDEICRLVPALAVRSGWIPALGNRVSTVRYPIPQRTFKYVATVHSVTDETCHNRTFSIHKTWTKN